jgi:hypothetical protein
LRSIKSMVLVPQRRSVAVLSIGGSEI